MTSRTNPPHCGKGPTAKSTRRSYVLEAGAGMRQRLPSFLEPILTTVGNKRVLAFFEPESGNCAFQAVIWNTADDNADTASRVRTNLNAGQLVIIDTPDNKTLKLQCGDNAERLAIIDNNHFIAAGAGN
jgi:hypothetical protein